MQHLELDVGRDFDPAFYGNHYDLKCRFQDFPSSQGWKLDPSTLVFSNTKVDLTEFPIFMQSWLFFGLITAVAYDDGKTGDRAYGIDALIEKGSRKIRTKELSGLLEQWQMWEIGQKGRKGQKMRMIRAQIALDLARRVVFKYCHIDNLEFEGNYQGVFYLDEKLSLSLMVLGETLTNAKARIIDQIGFDVRGWYGDPSIGWGAPKAIVDQMIKSGWCPRTIELLKFQLKNHAIGLFSAYSSHRNHNFEGHIEAKCDKQSPCKVKSVYPGRPLEYATGHHPECLHQPCWKASEDGSELQCRKPASGAPEPDEKKTNQPTCFRPCHEMFGVNIEDLTSILEAGKIPLVKFKFGSLENDITLELTDETCEPEYATISHVWADGYGNRTKNELHRCQLRYLRRLLANAELHQRQRYRRTYQDDKLPPLAFWMDTLLIPVHDDERHKAARKSAVRQIYKVFSKAKYTIVIDNDLTNTPWETGDYAATAMRILASGWMRRLWTLQEAYLSKKLLFVFMSEQERFPLIDLDDIELLYDDEGRKLATNLPSIARSYYNNLLGPDRKARNDKRAPTSGMSLVASVWRAAQWRTTSNKEHETLALATLLNLDFDGQSFGDAAPNKKDEDLKVKRSFNMRDFWVSLEENLPKSIPPGIIFMPGDRLEIPGFGWAPFTWMAAHSADLPDPIDLMARPATLLPNSGGLLVEYPGFLLHCEDREEIMGDKITDGFWFPVDNTLTEYYHVTWADDRLYDAKKGNVTAERNKDLAIILCRPRPGQTAAIGLLVEIQTVKQRDLGTDHVKRVFVVYIQRRVRVKRETIEARVQPRTAAIMDRDYAGQDKIICGEVLDEDQKWYVDCRPPSAGAEDVVPATRSERPVAQSHPEVRDRPFVLTGGSERGAFVQELIAVAAAEPDEERAHAANHGHTNGEINPSSQVQLGKDEVRETRDPDIASHIGIQRRESYVDRYVRGPLRRILTIR